MHLRSDEAGESPERRIASTCMGLHVRRASRILSQIYDAALQPIDLTLNQFTLLVAIRCLDSAPISRLAKLTASDQSTLSRNLSAMERSGWIAVIPGTDRRTRRVSLSRAGEALLEKAIPLWEETQRDLQERFGEAQWQSLLALLGEIRTLSHDQGTDQ